MNKRTVILRTLAVLMGLITIGTVVAYFLLRPNREWLAFYVACCGGVLVVNLGQMIFIAANKIQKNPNTVIRYD